MLEARVEAFKGRGACRWCGLGAAVRGSPRDHELPLSAGVAAGLQLRSWRSGAAARSSSVEMSLSLYGWCSSCKT